MRSRSTDSPLATGPLGGGGALTDGPRGVWGRVLKSAEARVGPLGPTVPHRRLRAGVQLGWAVLAICGCLCGRRVASPLLLLLEKLCVLCVSSISTLFWAPEKAGVRLPILILSTFVGDHFCFCSPFLGIPKNAILPPTFFPFFFYSHAFVWPFGLGLGTRFVPRFVAWPLEWAPTEQRDRG